MDKKVIIIGAGISGLVAAIELEKRGYSPLILEADSKVGGRVQTTVRDGFYMDHGFQVLLTNYPEAREYLDFDALDLQYFEPGAMIFGENKTTTLLDPRRNWAAAIPMLFSGIGTLSDKLKVIKLASRVTSLSISEIFEQPSVATIDFLRSYGFSERIISQFFKPFFAGIFLENELETSSRMFQFVFKMFAEGKAAIPAEGIQAIPGQLSDKLKRTEIKFNVKVDQVEPGIVSAGDQTFEYDDLIIATHPAKILNGLGHERAEFHEVTNFYFSAESSSIGKPLIGLLPGEDRLVNNFCFMTDIYPGYAPAGSSLLSATVIGPVADTSSFSERVRKEMEDVTGRRLKEVGVFTIAQALPVIDDMQCFIQPTEAKIQEHIFLAGDHLLNPSLNAAMTSGRIAAEAVANSNY
ncbi:protoporphyrinogen/coproporphyrinogen oxidase [Fulvivirga sedimenti]|uniref:FAD-dependent oxidoreductase n=1 Tax=Fulvivirga sedimenti TaxID=2879465 RepID=A0A9X1HSQ1_9BACT|nr:NAD(P)/FAD-dependent oxidoreductase [Fulvivirga sedimenti]MCA6074527.1 FAD-dependent oxidoreductase [Fulvivirga sedimenti]MCA6075704.1 FAD-dependent oxidoreductase [Fulvivirga sedimenti]MCA6076832.1 FAD-dependent oxidoreductase [Fulvivirga sedimenti]